MQQSLDSAYRQFTTSSLKARKKLGKWQTSGTAGWFPNRWSHQDDRGQSVPIWYTDNTLRLVKCEGGSAPVRGKLPLEQRLPPSDPPADRLEMRHDTQRVGMFPPRPDGRGVALEG